MSIVAELTIPAEQFALGTTLEAVPDVDVEFERVVTHSQEWVMPYLWVKGSDLDRFEREIARDPTVSDYEVADRFDGVDLYRVEWSDEIEEKVNAIFDQEGTLVEAAGHGDRWELIVRFGTRESLAELQSHFEEGHTAFTLQRLYSPTRPRQPEYNLTPEQRDTLVATVERGYFDVPRKAKLEDVADELEISTTAVSERLRRAVATLTENTLSVDGGLEPAREPGRDERTDERTT